MKLQVDRRVIQLNRPSPTSPDAFPRVLATLLKRGEGSLYTQQGAHREEKKEQKNKELTFRHGFALLPTVLYQAYHKLLE